MELSTPVVIPPPRFVFSYGEPMVVLGSCFAENIGTRLEEHKFAADVNPFGTLYNPASVAMALRRLLHPHPFTAGELFCHQNSWHSFAHHSRFSAITEADCLARINSRLSLSGDSLRSATRLVVTWGTAYVYRLRETGQVVSNCHKLPERMFERERLTVSAIEEEWSALLPELWAINPALKVLFTVSPIRHFKDGAHGNQLSKSTLLLAIDRLQERFPQQTDYFPAYELMMDELRDYRFYADDMLHPSPLAVEYIWQRFVESRLSSESHTLLAEWNEVRKALAHKPFQPDGEGYRRFLLQTLLKMERICQKIPSFDLSKEKEGILIKLGKDGIYNQGGGQGSGCPHGESTR